MKYRLKKFTDIFDDVTCEVCNKRMKNGYDVLYPLVSNSYEDMEGWAAFVCSEKCANMYILQQL
jgi:hypothetical protein